MTDMDKREAAIKRLKSKREFFSHLTAYVAVNGFLVAVWWMTSGTDSYFWPFWVMAGWGIGLVMHAWETYRQPISETAIQRQMEKM